MSVSRPDYSTPGTGIDLRSNINWQMFRVMAEFVEGYEFLFGLSKEITFFGSARFKENHKYYKQARDLAYRLGKKKFTIITGGGPGIMEAANRGAYDAKAVSVGLNIQLPSEQRVNKYVTKALGFNYFFTRKVMLSTSAQAYVFFPGGFGTMDELLEMVALVQWKVIVGVPIVLVGKDFWQPFINFIKSNVCKKLGAISQEDIDLMILVDSVDEAYEILSKTKERPYMSMDMAKPRVFDFKENANWRIFRIMAEFVEGLQFVSDLRKQVIVFGAGHIKKDSEYYKSARSLGKRLGKARFEVVTLGGGGVMEAANKGASEANGTSVGLFRMRVGKQKVNPYANKSIGFHYYFTRKVVMAATARVYVFFPGGYGTIDAFFDLITLIQTGKMEKIPIYLMGKEYWSPLLNFIKMEMLQKNNTISPKDIEFFRLVDSVDEVYDYVVISDPRREFLFF